LRVQICGVRGSTPATGRDFLRYGGNTSCVALSHDGASPSLVLDAGTGLQQLGRRMGSETFHGAILLGHLHWDHTHGLPFFPNGDREDAHVRLYLPSQPGGRDVLKQLVGPPHFPITTDDLRGDWGVELMEEGTFEIQGFTVTTREIPHKGGRTFGFRVSDDRATLAYLSDHSPITFGPGPDGYGEYHQAAMALAADADLLLHDAQYTPNEFVTRSTFGHSTMDYAIGLGQRAGARRVLLFHHDPSRTDDQLDAEAAARNAEAAAEGMVIDL
jgi:phosphoribosyl 1,2-cyclic phosphodiesterase